HSKIHGTRQPAIDRTIRMGRRRLKRRESAMRRAKDPSKHRARWKYRSARSEKYFAPRERSWRYLPEWFLFRPRRDKGCREGFLLDVRGRFLMFLHPTYARIWLTLSRQRAGRF